MPNLRRGMPLAEPRFSHLTLAMEQVLNNTLSRAFSSLERESLLRLSDELIEEMDELIADPEGTIQTSLAAAELAATESEASATAAATSASTAEAEVDTAMATHLATIEASKADAETAAINAAASADAAALAGNVYDDTTAGLAATASGDYFSVPSSVAGEFLILYKNNAGVSTQVSVYPSLEGIRENMSGYIIDEYGDSVLPPAALFVGGETGAAYDVSDIGTLWQDTARTTPVTAHGDLVNCIDDVSGNGHYLFPGNASIGVYKIDANGYPYIEVPSGGFYREAPPTHTITIPHQYVAAYSVTGSIVGSGAMVFGARSGTNEAFGAGHRNDNNATTIFVSSLNGVGAVAAHSALGSVTQGYVTVVEGYVGEGNNTTRINGGRAWASTNTATAALSIASARVGINISGSGLGATANQVNFRGGVIIDRVLTEAERRGYTNYLKARIGLRDLEKQAYDIFGVAGQSNAVGQGDKATSTVVPWGEAVEFHDGFIKPLADPTRHYSENTTTGNVSGTGSAWPAFATEYYALTGRRALLVGGGASGVGLTLATQWNTDPKYLDQLTDNMLAAKSFIESNGGTAVLRGVFWAGGENDALNQVSEATFKADFIEFYTKVKEHLGARVKLLVLAIDQDTTAGHDSWFTAIRNAQIAAASETPGIEMVMSYQGFETAGLLEDTIHWNQTALNIAGIEAATNTAPLFPE